MRIIVLVKEVPEMEKVLFDSEHGVIDRSSAEAEINPFDKHALQAAADIKKKLKHCTITAISMGPERTEKSLRAAYAYGADECVLLSDKLFVGADTLATAHTLAAGIRYLGDFDIILCGEKSIDGDTAQVGPETAKLLDIPHCSYVEKIEAKENEALAKISELCGFGQLRCVKYPALFSVTKDIAPVELPPVRRKIASKRIQIQKLGFDALSKYGLEIDQVGLKGSATRVRKVEIVEQKKKANKIFHDYETFSKSFSEWLGGN